MNKIKFLCFLMALAFLGCRKNIDEVTVTETPYVPPVLEQWEQEIVNVKGSVTGFVVDETGEPVKAANVKLGNLTTTTDDYGHFFFKNTNLNRKGTLVQVEKQGYFPGSRRFLAQQDAENRVKIQLIPKSFDFSFDSNAGGVVETNGGAKVSFSPNSIRKADGTSYDGTVRVAAFWLDPSDQRTLDRMPGNLQGVDKLAEEVVLRTAGMMAVELESDAGEPLNILKGHTAEISMPVPAELAGHAPAEVPNWSYSEAHGMWAEEGVSVLEGNNYVGQVSHFTYWNHDFKDPLIEFSATFVNSDGTPLENFKVVVRQPGTGLYGYGYTSDQGVVTGLIPKDYALVMEFYGDCNGVAYTQDIGPFSADTDLGVITVSIITTTITATLVDCDDAPVTNGLIIIEYNGGKVYEYTDDGNLEALFICYSPGTTMDITGVDLTNLKTGDPVQVTPVAGVNDLGQISACDQDLEDYVRFVVDGVEEVFYPAYLLQTDSLAGSGAGTLIYYYGQGNNSFSFYFLGESTGDYSGSANGLDRLLYPNKGWVFESGSFENFDVTAYGAVGEPVIGSFSGTMYNYAANPPGNVSVSGNFRIRRQQ